MTNTLDAALDLAGKGFRVFPCVINGKDPICDWKDVATTDPSKIRSLWTCPIFDSVMDYNIGVALPKDMLVVDVDVRDGKEGDKALALIEAIDGPLPETYTVDTPSGGEHRYFRVERDSSTFPKTLSPHIDLQGAGKYVVGPGSVIGGRTYRARSESRASDIPMARGWLCDLPTPKRRNKDDRVGTEELAKLDTAENLKRATEYLEGAPDHDTYQRAARVKDFGVSEEQCLNLILTHWKGADTRDLDHLEFRVGNAYRYGQNVVGAADPAVEFDDQSANVNDWAKPGDRKGKLWVEWWQDAQPDLNQPFLIDDVLDLGTMAVTYGDSNVGKTYIVLDQARCIAAGVDWNGHKVKQGLVVYIAAEGGRGFRKRIAAFRKHYGAEQLPFALVPCPIDLFGAPGDTGALVRLIKDAEAHTGQTCVMVVVDTLARAMGGGDENTSLDMGKLVGHCDKIRAATGATVNLIHHTGKDKAKGARGSSALRAATDTEIEVDAGVVSVQKQRDMAKAEAMNFQLTTVEIGTRTDGRAVTACVVEWLASSEFENRVTPEARQLFTVLEQLEGDAPDGRGIPWSDWWKAAGAVMRGARGGALGRTHMVPLRHQLTHAGLVADVNGRWKTSENDPQ